MTRASLFAAALTLCAPAPWLIEGALHDRLGEAIDRCEDGSSGCGHVGAVELDAGGLRLRELDVRRRGLRIQSAGMEAVPRWDGVAVHFEGLQLERSAVSPSTPSPPSLSAPSGSPTPEAARIDTHGLRVQVLVSGTTAVTVEDTTVLLDTPALDISPDGTPRASFGLTIQHPMGSVHSGGRLHATPLRSFSEWSVQGTVALEDGPPLALRAEANRTRVRAELAHEGGGTIQLAAWPHERAATIDARNFPLHGLGRLANTSIGEVSIDASSAVLGGHASVVRDDAWHFKAEGLTLRDLVTSHPQLASSDLHLQPLRLDGHARFTSSTDLEAKGSVRHGDLLIRGSASRDGSIAQLQAAMPSTPCQVLFAALPGGFAEPMRGTRVEGALEGRINFRVDLDEATARAAVLEADPWAEPPAPGTLDVAFPFRERCRVTQDPAAIDLQGLRGAYHHRFIDANGQAHNRTLAAGAPHYAPLSQVKLLGDAFVTLEDTLYYKHGGLDLEQVAGALWHNLGHGEVQRGASTITQQAARNLFLGLDRTAARKLQEAFVATRLDTVLSKRRLLEIYVNIIELAPGVHGVHDAAAFYFGRPASKLSIRQATHLAMLAPAPKTYAERFVSGQIDEAWREDLNHHLRRLARHHVISKEQLHAALRDELKLLDRRG